MENNKIDVLRVEPLKKPELISIENSVEDFQREVEGYFEITYPFEDPVAILCNEEGKIDKCIRAARYAVTAGPSIRR